MTWVLLISFGLSGVLAALTNGSQYFQRNYFQTEDFQSQLLQFVDLLHVYELNDMTSDEMKREITVTAEEIEEHRYRYGPLEEQIANINSQYEQRIEEAKTSGNKDIEQAYIKERDGKITDITENFNNDEHVRGKVIEEKKQKIDGFFENLKSNKSQFANLESVFTYSLKDVESGEVYTNIAPDSKAPAGFLNQKDMLFAESLAEIEQHYLYDGTFLEMFEYNEVVQQIYEKENKRFEGSIGLPKNAPENHYIMLNYRDYQERQVVFLSYIAAAFAAFLAGLWIAKRKSAQLFSAMEKWRPLYEKVPVDVRFVIFIATGMFFLVSLFIIGEQFIYFNQGIYYDALEAITANLLSAALLALTLIQFIFLTQYRKDSGRLKADWERSVINRGVRMAREAFLIRSIGTQIIILLSIVFLFGGLMAVVLVQPGFILLIGPIVAVIGLPIFFMIIKNTGYFNQILQNAGELAAGKMGSDLEVSGKSVFARLAADINTLRDAVRHSHKEQAKSERLKSELITNVSHDLRTPLTSIITYTELLKTPGLGEADREAYIEIIDRKSKRLKVLIDDLFEATKMASGNIELKKEKVDLIQLLQQALAEHNESLAQSTLQLRVSHPDHPVYAVVDGQKLWRVFDNLIGNILKYSLEHSRVYISVKAAEGQVVLTFKNVTKYELGEDLGELFERFKRGDESRHTEGSGLGLAIAKSIVDLHNGTLDIEVDGDLFKVTVTLEKAE